MDQGLIGASNFLLNILLARWLEPSAYGAYALAYAAFLLLANVHTALLLEPMSVLGTSQYRSQRARYLGVLLWLHGGLTLPAAAVIGGGALFFGNRSNPELAGALAGMALAAPCILLFWLARGNTYLDLSPGPAAKGALLYCGMVLGGLLIVYRYGKLSPFVAFLLMAAGALVFSAYLLLRARPALRSNGGRAAVRDVWRRHWVYGRWELGTGGLNWLTENIVYFLTAAVLGMAEVGALRALANIFLPVPHIGLALRRIIQPYVSDVSSQHGHGAAKVPVHRTVFVLTSGTLVYCVLVSVLGSRLIHLLYGNRFEEYSWLIPGVALSVALAVAAQGFAGGLRAMQSPSSVFASNFVSGTVSVAVTLPAAWAFGLAGVILATVLTNISFLIAVIFLFRRKVRDAPCLAEVTRL